VKQIMDAAQASDDKSNFTINGVEVSTVWILPLSAVLRLVKFFSSDACGAWMAECLLTSRSIKKEK
jgi:hypothetical protein